jgi:pimeloyl-ACP methyl ester carboxylesterase
MVYQAIGSALDARRCPPSGQRLDVGGYCLHFRRAGEGTPTVVLESEIAASSLSWTPVQREVSKFTTVCSYDRSGLGWSDPSPSPRACAHIVGELGTLLEKAGLPEPYVLVGHSFGGLVVRSYSSKHPDTVAGVVLVDPIQPREWSAPNTYQKRMLQGRSILFSRWRVVGAAGRRSPLPGPAHQGKAGLPTSFPQAIRTRRRRCGRADPGRSSEAARGNSASGQAMWCNPKPKFP